MCGSCKGHSNPDWATTGSLTDEDIEKEMQSRYISSRRAVMRVAAAASRGGIFRIAHDSGDGAVLSHCPVCGSGGIVGRSDGSTECQFCKTIFTVQIQPKHPFMPQTIDGDPYLAPGMPGGSDTDLSGPEDPVARVVEEGDQDPTSGPEADSMPPSHVDRDAKEHEAPASDEPLGEEGPEDAEDPEAEDGEESRDPDGATEDEEGDEEDDEDLPPFMRKKKASLFRTASGASLDEYDYINHLALSIPTSTERRSSMLARVKEWRHAERRSR